MVVFVHYTLKCVFLSSIINYYSSKEEVREEGKKGLRKPSPEEEVWQNRSCDLPNFASMVQYLHKRVKLICTALSSR